MEIKIIKETEIEITYKNELLRVKTIGDKIYYSHELKQSKDSK